jgi:hypothetical protein
VPPARPPLTPELRRRLQLPETAPTPFRWSFAALVVGLACAPLVLAGYRLLPLGIAAIGLGGLPLLRWIERRDAVDRERVYTDGVAVSGEVLAVEPAGQGGQDHLVQVRFEAGGKQIDASVRGCTLARRGLSPGDRVTVLHLPSEPRRCLVLDLQQRAATRGDDA